MFRWVNVRVAALLCVLVLLGIMVVLGIYYCYTLLCIIAIVIVLTALTVLAILTRKFRRSAFLLVFFLLGCVSMIVQICCTSTQLCEQYVDMSGTVDSITEMDYSVQVVLSDNSYYALDDYGNYLSDEDSLSGKVILYVSYNDAWLAMIDCGDTVYLRGVLDSLYVLQDSVNTYYYKYNYTYTVSSDNIYKVEDGSASLVQSVEQYVLDTLEMYMPDNYGTAYAMLLGDKTNMAEGQYEIYQTAGVAHLFAISGMHIGIIVMALSKLLSLLRIKQKLHICIIIPPLLMYGYLCGFSASVSRAIIMSFVMLLSKVVYSKVDIISSLSIAMLVILLVRPLYIFDVGFLLSFASVYGIATIGNSLMRVVRKWTERRILLYVADLIILSLSVNLTTLLIVAQYFDTVAILGVFTNLLVVPILPILFVGCVIGLIPYCGGILTVIDSILTWLSGGASTIASWPWATVILPSVGIAIIVWLIVLYILGGYINVKGVARVVTVLAMIVVFVCVSTAVVLPDDTSDSIYILDSKTDMLAIITEKDSDVVHVINNVDNADDVDTLIEFVSGLRYSHMYIYCTDITSVDLQLLLQLQDNANATKLYYYDAYHNSSIEQCDVSILRIDKEGYTNNSVQVGSVYSGGLVALDVITSYCRIAFVSTEYYYSLYGYGEGVSYDCIYCATDSTILDNFVTDIPLLVPTQQYNDNIYGLNMYGNFTITTKGDTISINRGMIL